MIDLSLRNIEALSKAKLNEAPKEKIVEEQKDELITLEKEVPNEEEEDEFFG